MTTASQRSMAFIAGLELLESLLDRRRTPRVPQEIRDRARHVLRHHPSVAELSMALDHSEPLASFKATIFDVATLDAYCAKRYAPLPAPPALPPVED